MACPIGGSAVVGPKARDACTANMFRHIRRHDAIRTRLLHLHLRVVRSNSQLARSGCNDTKRCVVPDPCGLLAQGESQAASNQIS